MNLRLPTIALLLVAGTGGAIAKPAVVPAPTRYEARPGAFTLDAHTILVAAGPVRELAEQLRSALRPATGLPLPILPDHSGANAIRLALDPERDRLGPEGYTLTAGPAGVDIRAAAPAGLFYGLQTLRQLLPPAIFRQAVVDGQPWVVPGVEIEDRPRFSWRGSHLDVGRHFMPIDFIKRHLDLMALHKLNVFHWHLTEDQGWRLEIRRFPRLTQVGARRAETIIPMYMRAERPNLRRYDGEPHDGHYTQADVREIVRYAADRFITVVPEIEMPGHATAAIAAYPEWGNRPDQPPRVVTHWGVFETVFNVEESTLTALEQLLDEVVELFPSPWIHLGGDECPKTEWSRCERALARMLAEGLAEPGTTLTDLQNHRDETGRPADHPALHRLQAWFMGRMAAHLARHGRRLIGWSEIVDGGLPPGALVMSWLGESAGITAAQAGHDVIMTPTSHTYFDYYQSRGPEPHAIGGLLPLERVYTYEPIPAALAGTPAAERVLGTQGQLWTEYMPTPRQVAYMAWPRLAALAEVAWSPAEARDWETFRVRLAHHLTRLDVLGLPYRPLDPP